MMSVENDEDLRRIDAALTVLGEHFDAVQIFATRYEPAVENGTLNISRGTGNWNTRKGQVDEWVEIQRGIAREKGAQIQRDDNEDRNT